MSQTNDFRTRYGPWAVVAGGSIGLGAEYATQLAARGLNLVLIARNQEKLEQLATQLKSTYAIEVRTLPLDLTHADSDKIIAQETSDLTIGLLIYNAANALTGPFFDHTLQEHLDEITVNCRTSLTLTYLFGQRMLKLQRGGIVLMSSLTSAQGTAFVANYGATKAYNRILAEGLWEELRTQGVDVLSCCAGAISTPNYLESLSADAKPGLASVSVTSPRVVVSETLAALGKKPTVIPGWNNRLGNVILQRFLPRRTTIKLLGRVLRGMYATQQ